MNKYRRQIAKIDDKIKELQEKKQSLQIEMMLSCSHPIKERFEVDFGTHYSNSLPYQFCKLCGFGESGWRTPLFFKDTYLKDLPKVSAKFANEYTVKVLSIDDMDALQYPNREEHRKRAKELAPFSLPKELQRK